MAPQSDQTIQNATFPTVRSDINDNLAALFTQSSGSSEPTTKVAFQPWVDTSTSPPTWKIRNAANSGWITIGVLDPANFQASGVTPIANGGTGETTAADAIAALLPSQTGNANKALITNGASLLWSALAGSSFTKYTFAAGTGTGSTRTHTWTKPDSGSTVIVLLWGGGGGGARNFSVAGGAGAGSNCSLGIFQFSELGATETITLGQGGAGAPNNFSNGSSGTNSTFGSHLTGYRGIGGQLSGDNYAQGSTPFGSGGHSTSKGGDFAFSIFSGGYGGRPADTGTERRGEGGGAAIFGAGGGGGGSYSGGGGGGGTSIFAGNGGSGAGDSGNASSGGTPGGGGGGAEDGSAGSGGNGECWVLIF